jgi:hypothetical protein
MLVTGIGFRGALRTLLHVPKDPVPLFSFLLAFMGAMLGVDRRQPHPAGDLLGTDQYLLVPAGRLLGTKGPGA